MDAATQSSAQRALGSEDGPNESGLLSSACVLDILRLILAGSPLTELLTVIVRLVESRDDGTLCTIWLPDDDGKQLHCAVTPSLPGLSPTRGPC
jgi:formate hydrogenlyase transcriptional activator